MYDIVILTEKKYINPIYKDWYTNQVILEDKLLIENLVKKKLKVCKKDWADSHFDWTKTKYAIFRTTWDYFERYDEFFNWLEKTKHKTRFINSYDLIKWNIDKYYLRELSNKEINIPPTLFLTKSQNTSLTQLFNQTQWDEVVLKPTISGAARETYRINKSNHTKYEKIFQKLISKENMIFQEFQKNILKLGEISLIIIGGEFTHAVKKKAKKGDFRVQDDHGGTVEEYEPNSLEISFAENCIKKCPSEPLYARVDIIYDNNNSISLCELELIEPELWLRNSEISANKLADEILKII